MAAATILAKKVDPFLPQPDRSMNFDFTARAFAQLPGIPDGVATASRKSKVSGGYTNLTEIWSLTFEEGVSPPSLDVVVKVQQATEGGKRLGLAREAEFIRSGAIQRAGLSFPKVYQSWGDLSTGEKLIVTDLVDGTQLGYFFRGKSPGTWGADFDSQLALFPRTRPADAARALFHQAAKLHGRYPIELAEQADGNGLVLPLCSPFEQVAVPDWLRSSGWVRGLGKESWMNVMSDLQSRWKQRKLHRPVDFEIPHALEDFLDRGMSLACDFELFAKEHQLLAKKGLLSIVHGDFHPGNMVAVPGPSSGGEEIELIMFDWEMVGVGSGPQELAQALISHMVPEDRRACEATLLREYHSALVHARQQAAEGAAAVFPTLQEVQEEYVRGGLAKWAWLYIYMLATETIPDKAMSYFGDQMLAFIRDWDVAGETLQPRA